MRPDVFLQHAGLLAADAALLADVLPPAATADVNVVLVGFVPRRKKSKRQMMKAVWRSFNVSFTLFKSLLYFF